MKVYGPYLRDDGRMHVQIVYSDGARRVVSYPKWLVEEYEGRLLEEHEEVHHIDEDYTNNDLSNLEIRDKIDHLKHHHPKTGITEDILEFQCAGCGQIFKADYDRVRSIEYSINKKRQGPFCTKSCMGKHCNQFGKTPG